MGAEVNGFVESGVTGCKGMK